MSTNCTLDTCDISESLYGYRPNVGVNVFFAFVYITIDAYCIYLFTKRRGWIGYTVSVLLGALLELIGYASRVLGYSNPFLRMAWIIQYSSLTIAPVFTTAATYVCIGHVAEYLGRGAFDINPKLYLRLFITSDVFALGIQSGGGGLSFGETPSASGGITLGQGIVIGGLIIQVISLSTFLVLFMGVVWPSNIIRPKTFGPANQKEKKLRTFVLILFTAIILIIGRSIFRVIEFSEGFSGSIVHNQKLFIVFDGFPIAIASTLMVVFHPMDRVPTTPRFPIVTSEELIIMPYEALRGGGPTRV
ncbi:RTA1-domain-containing protein [Hypoxylon argillaceum]|nr:RTA1-domain-containing protein [Hypoxylon argillaceum]